MIEKIRSHPVLASLAAATVLGSVSALGDLIWALYIPDGAVIPGVVHGVLIFVLFALVLGWVANAERATRRLLLTLPLAGMVIAATFYPIAYAVGYLPALIISWCSMWITLAVLLSWVKGDDRLSFLGGFGRGLLAALGSGLAFSAISDVWTQPDPSPNYLVRGALWTFAFAPGFLALLISWSSWEKAAEKSRQS